MNKQIETLKSFGVDVKVNTTANRISILATKENKRKKIGMDILINCYVKTEQQSINVLTELIESLKDKQERKIKELEAKESFDIKKEYPIGTILYNSWGYEQTNINYYKVIGYKGNKTLILVEVGCILTETISDIQGKKKPNPENVIGEPFTKQVSVKGTYNYINFNSYSCLSKCDENILTNGLYYSTYY